MDAKEYQHQFGIDKKLQKPSDKHLRAFTQVADIRKFEIDMYWKRATYFWTIIAVTFTGFFAIASANEFPYKNTFTVLLSSMGTVFTLSWYLVNRGSKYWQENWENHLDLMEDDVTGPLYKTVLERPNQNDLESSLFSTDPDIIDKYMTGPGKFSASKINQWVAIYILGIWMMLTIITLASNFNFINKNHEITGLSLGLIIVFWSVLIACCMFKKGNSYIGIQSSKARRRISNLL